MAAGLASDSVYPARSRSCQRLGGPPGRETLLRGRPAGVKETKKVKEVSHVWEQLHLSRHQSACEASNGSRLCFFWR